ALDEAADPVGVVGEIERLGDVGRARVAVVAVRDDADADAGDLLHQPADRALELLPYLREARVHAAGGVEGEDDLDRVVDHGWTPGLCAAGSMGTRRSRRFRVRQ